jgi:hypothetical protein
MIWCLLQIWPAFSLTLSDGQEIRSLISVGETHKYLILTNSLIKDSRYEIRVSYLGTVGANFEIYWDCNKKASTRRLLDTEKLLFSTDSEGNISSGCNVISIYGTRNSRSISKEYHDKSIWYNIKLDRYNKIFQVPVSVLEAIFGVIIALVTAYFLYRIIIAAPITDKDL